MIGYVKKVGPSSLKMTLRPEMSDISICDDKYVFFALLALTNSIQKAPITLSSRQMNLRTHMTLRGSIAIEFMDCRLFIDFTVESAETG